MNKKILVFTHTFPDNGLWVDLFNYMRRICLKNATAFELLHNGYLGDRRVAVAAIVLRLGYCSSLDLLYKRVIVEVLRKRTPSRLPLPLAHAFVTRPRSYLSYGEVGV